MKALASIGVLILHVKEAEGGGSGLINSTLLTLVSVTIALEVVSKFRKKQLI